MACGGGSDGSGRDKYRPRDTGFVEDAVPSSALDSFVCAQENLARESHDVQRDIDRLQRELNSLGTKHTPRMRDFVRTMLSSSDS